MARLRATADEAGVPVARIRQGRRHELWDVGGVRLVIRRHREINELTARAIIARAGEAAR